MKEQHLDEESWDSAVQTWLKTYAPVDRWEAVATSLLAHMSQPSTVLSLLGVYDSGKSSLLRRLLIDAGLECPDWLTISAQHETFEVTPIEVEGVLIRDTPGLSPTARDPRGLQNNRRALEAAALTDVLVLVVPPQLATGEVEELRAVLEQQWPLGSLRCVISRFDEAGVDASGDPDEYRALARRKTAELRQSLGLSEDVPVDVVAPDAWQFAGEARNPDPSVWDHSRDWDGIAEFRASLLPLVSPRAAFRAAAATRHWAGALDAEVDQLTVQQEQTLEALQTVDQADRRNDRVNARLHELELGIRAELEAALGNVLDMALLSGVVDADKLRDTTTAALDSWLSKAQADLRLLMEDFDAEFDRQMARSAWRDLDAHFGAVADPAAARVDTDGVDSSASQADRLGPQLLKVNSSLTKSLKEVREVFTKRTKNFSAKAERIPSVPPKAPTAKSAPKGLGGVEGALNVGEVLVALGPALVDMFGLISEYRREQAQQKAKRDALVSIERKLQHLRSTVGEAAFAVIVEDMKAARAAVDESAQPVKALSASLHEQADLLAQALTDAVILVAAVPQATISD